VAPPVDDLMDAQIWQPHYQLLMYILYHHLCNSLKSDNLRTVFLGLQDALAHKMHPNFFIQNFRKNNDECILILIIYWKKTGLLHMKISNHNIIYSSSKPIKSSSLPLKSSSQLFSLDASLIDVWVFISLEINTYPWRIRRSSNLGHIFRGKECVL
jgi:hypothetical protein